MFCEHGDEKEKVRFAGKNGVCDVQCDHCHCQDQYCSCYTSNETHACPYDGESGDGESGNGESGDGESGDGGGDGDAYMLCDGNERDDVCNCWYHGHHHR